MKRKNKRRGRETKKNKELSHVRKTRDDLTGKSIDSLNFR